MEALHLMNSHFILHTFMLTYMVSFMLVCICTTMRVLSMGKYVGCVSVWVCDDIWVLKNIIRFIMQRNSGVWSCLRLLPRAVLPLSFKIIYSLATSMSKCKYELYAYYCIVDRADISNRYTITYKYFQTYN